MTSYRHKSYLNCAVGNDGVRSKGKWRIPEVRWILEIGTSGYNGMVNRNVNGCKPRKLEAG